MLLRLNLEEVCRYFKRTVASVNEEQDRKLDEQMEPIPSAMHGAITRTKLSDLQRYEEIGKVPACSRDWTLFLSYFTFECCINEVV